MFIYLYNILNCCGVNVLFAMPLDNPPVTPLAIINEEDIVRFISSEPSPGELVNLTKHELQLIAQYFGMNIPSEWNKPPILDALKAHMFRMSNPSEDPTQGEGECKDVSDSSRSAETSPPVSIQIQPPTLSPADYLKLRELELKVEYERIKSEEERHAQEIQLQREKLSHP